jgi:hypothetical protein
MIIIAGVCYKFINGVIFVIKAFERTNHKCELH